MIGRMAREADSTQEAQMKSLHGSSLDSSTRNELRAELMASSRATKAPVASILMKLQERGILNDRHAQGVRQHAAERVGLRPQERHQCEARTLMGDRLSCAHLTRSLTAEGTTHVLHGGTATS